MFALLHSRGPTVPVFLAWPSWRSLVKDATKAYMELTNKSGLGRLCFEARFTSESGSVVAELGPSCPAGFVSAVGNRKEGVLVCSYTLYVIPFVPFLVGNHVEIRAT